MEINWKKYADLDIQAKNKCRRLVDKKGIIVHLYKFETIEISREQPDKQTGEN